MKKYRVIAITGKNMDDSIQSISDRVKIYRMPSLIMPGTKKMVSMAFPSEKSIENIFRKERVSVIHIHFPFYLGAVCLKVARRLQIPVICTNHTQPENWTYHIRLNNFEPINRLIYRYLVRFFNRANIVVSPSSFGARILKEHGLTARTEVISNGVDRNRFRPCPRAVALKSVGMNKSNEKTILYIGRLQREKRPNLLIEAFADVARQIQARLIIIGTGYLEASLYQRCSQLHITDKVTFIKSVSGAKLHYYYCLSDVFVLPSNIELQSIVTLESIACGTPTIVSDSNKSAAPEIVSDCGLTFQHDNAHDLADKIVKVLSNRKLAKSMRSKSLKAAISHDFNNTLRKYDALYRE
jgi:glycosyltransferase involved in cell wall biosynthesis